MHQGRIMDIPGCALNGQEEGQPLHFPALPYSAFFTLYFTALHCTLMKYIDLYIVNTELYCFAQYTCTK